IKHVPASRYGLEKPDVFQVYQEGVEVALVQSGKDATGRSDGLHLVAFAFEKELQRLKNIRLIVGDEDAGGGGGGGHPSKVSGAGGSGRGVCVRTVRPAVKGCR